MLILSKAFGDSKCVSDGDPHGTALQQQPETVINRGKLNISSAVWYSQCLNLGYFSLSSRRRQSSVWISALSHRTTEFLIDLDRNFGKLD